MQLKTFFEKINKIDKTLARVIKEKKVGWGGLISIWLEMKKEKLQWTPQKYEES